MRNKRVFIISFASIVLILFISISLVRNNNSPEATAKRFVSAVNKKDFNEAKRIVPSYSDGTKISESSYSVLFSQLSKKNSASFLLNKENFKIEDKKGLFSKKTFLPKKRYVTVTTEGSNEKVSVFQNDTEIKMKNGKIGPLIPYTYDLFFEVDHPTLGKAIKKEKVPLDKELEKEVKLTNTATFLSSSSFQKELVSVVSDFFFSYNKCIRQNFDFSSLQYSDEEIKVNLMESMTILKPFLETYSHSFQTIIMNNDSLKMSGDQQSIYFDIYIDRLVSVKLKEEVVEDSESLMQDDSKSANVTLIYDDQSKGWFVSEIDFGTYEQDPKNWENKQQIKQKQRNEATWSDSQSSDGKVI